MTVWAAEEANWSGSTLQRQGILGFSSLAGPGLTWLVDRDVFVFLYMHISLYALWVGAGGLGECVHVCVRNLKNLHDMYYFI